MLRTAKKPLAVPNGVKVSQQSGEVSVTGPKGTLTLRPHRQITISCQDSSVAVGCIDGESGNKEQLGTVCALLRNMFKGVTEGFEKRLLLSGVGYRAQLSGKSLQLSLGLSHPAVYLLPEGVTGTLPSATEIVLKAVDCQLLGQVAAEIRSLRPPEPYKGKGIRYADEIVRRKVTKKKKG